MTLEKRIEVLEKELAEMKEATQKQAAALKKASIDGAISLAEKIPTAAAHITADRFIIGSGDATLICLSKF